MPGHHSLDDPSLEGNPLCLAVTFEHGLEGVVIVKPERPFPSQLIAKRVWRIDMGARDPAVRHRLGRGVGPTVHQQLGQEVGMWPARTLAARRRYRLRYLGPAD